MYTKPVCKSGCDLPEVVGHTQRELVLQQLPWQRRLAAGQPRSELLVVVAQHGGAAVAQCVRVKAGAEEVCQVTAAPAAAHVLRVYSRGVTCTQCSSGMSLAGANAERWAVRARAA
jgi:hypothetical protein